MRIFSAFSLFSFILLIHSCKQDSNSGEFVIKGNFTNPEKNTVILEELGVKELTPIDSAVIDEEGDFIIKYKPDDIGLYILRVGERNFITLLIDRGEHIKITADASKMAYTYSVEGSEGSQLLKDYYEHTAMNKLKVDSLARLFRISKEKPDFLRIRTELDSSYRMVFKDQQEYVKEFISRNPSSLASLIVLNKRFGNGYVLSEDEHFEYFQKLDSGLMSAYPGNKHSLDHHKRVTEILRNRMEQELADQKLQPGNPAPEISVEDSNGVKIPLYSVLEKRTLIYFWTAGSALARQVHPGLKELYDKHKDKGLEIYAVSLDRNPGLWKAAVKLDGLEWIQLNDERGNASPLIKLYNLPEELPYFYLLDEEGKILLRGKKKALSEIIENIKTCLDN